MKYGKLLVMLCCLLFIVGCGGRYQTYMLIKGEVSEEGSESNENQSATVENEHEHEVEISRYVLVDRLSGKMFYFNELQGNLEVYNPKE